MSELVGVIQKIAQETMKAMKPEDKAVGTVLSVSPLKIQLDISMPPIPEPALILTDAVKERIVQVQGGSGGTVTVWEGLKAGDQVLMLRCSGGQEYIVLSKL